MQTPEEFDRAIAGLLETEKTPRPYCHWWTMLAGNKITACEITGDDQDTFKLTFEDGQTLALRDGGRSCCESRYLTCDDDLHEYIGAYLRGVSLGRHQESDESVVHEQQFVHVTTTLGTIVLCTHNEHNGYYGGFNICAKWTSPDGQVIEPYSFTR